MKLHDYTEQLLSLYNFYDGGIMVNKDCVIEYYYNNRPDINTLSESEMIGKTIFEIYPSINEKNSTLLRVIHTGIPMHQHYQKLENYKGEQYGAICSTLPIFDEEKIVGAVEIFMYTTDHEKFLNINLQDFGLLDGEPIAQNLDDIISVSEEMQTLKERIVKVARTKSTVMIYGETGTGKEMVAESIHTSGSRRQKKFVSQNCAAIPANLLESILFGTVRGSFTGAENRKGLLEVADGGTLFLDEINTLDYNLQAKLLKAIENGKIMRVGGTEEIKVNVRIIAATNKDLFMMVQDGTFRDDLYYRLKVVQIDLPELSERSGDIQALTAYFIKQYNKIFGKNILGLSKEAEAFFQNYPWHGNVRELKNTIEGCFNFASGPVIKLEDISWYEPPHKEAPTPILKGTLKETVKAYEKNLITETLHECGNISKAAEKLGLTRQNLNNKMKEYQLDPQSILLV